MKTKIGKKRFALIAAFCIILAAGLAVANQEIVLRLANPNPLNIPLPGRLVGHSSEDVVVNLDGGGAV